MDLFIDLGASLEQLEFPVIYASGIAGTSSLDPDPSTQEKTMEPILDAVLEHIPSPDTMKKEVYNFNLHYLTTMITLVVLELVLLKEVKLK